MPKYGTLAQLKAAYDSGELDPEDKLILDNDCCSVWTEADGPVFEEDGPMLLIEQALDLLGIPWGR